MKMRTWGQRKCYIRRNSRTGKKKYFKTYEEMMRWALRLPLKTYYEWCNWEYQD